MFHQFNCHLAINLFSQQLKWYFPCLGRKLKQLVAVEVCNILDQFQRTVGWIRELQILIKLNDIIFSDDECIIIIANGNIIVVIKIEEIPPDWRA